MSCNSDNGKNAMTKSNKRQYWAKILLENNSEEELRQAIYEARQAGELDALSRELVEAVFEESLFEKRIDNFLESLVFTDEEIETVSSDDQSPEIDATISPTHAPKLPDQHYKSLAQRALVSQAIFESPEEHITEEAYTWVCQEISREFSSVDNDAEAVKRRSFLLQMQSVLKYASGDSLGLFELSEYGDDLSPVTHWMMIHCISQQQESLPKSTRLRHWVNKWWKRAVFA
jgi:hypothetical protein